MNPRSMRSMFIYLLIGVAVLAIFFTVFGEPFKDSSEVPVSRMITMAAEGKIRSIEVKGDTLSAVTLDERNLTSR